MKKRMLALLAVLCCVALVAALFVACNNGEEGQTDNTGVTTPGDDDAQQGGETPDDEGQGGETPDDEQGGETQDPADPDEGEENPDEDIEEPETPDEDIEGPENPGEDDGLAPPTSVEELFVDPAYQNSEYMIKVEDALNTYLKEKIVSTVSSSLDIKNIGDIEWRIDGSASDTSINKITISFTNYASDTSKGIYVQSVTPKGGLTLEDLYNPDETKLNDAFKLAIIGGAKYNYEFSFNYDPSIQESSAALTEALKNVAIKDGDLEIEIDESAEFYIKDGGYQVDTTMGSEARQVTLFAKTDHGYQELVYRIAYENYDIGKLVEKINAGRYRMAGADKGEFTGHIIGVADNGDADAIDE